MNGVLKRFYLVEASLKLLSLVLMSAFISCSNNDHEEKVKLVFWHSFVANSLPALEKLVADYEAQNPDVDIIAQYVPSGDPLVQKLITAIQSSTSPDIAWVHSDFLDKLVSADAIFKMDHFINGKNGFTIDELKDFFPQLIENAKWRDTLYALPMEATTLALIYNIDLLEAAGINTGPPGNWDDLKDYVDKLTIDKDGDGKYDQYGFYVPVFPASGPLSVWMLLQWEPFLWQAGGCLVNENQTALMYNDTSGVKALKLWKELFDRQDFSRFSLSHDVGFASGSIAMVMDGPWNLPLYRKISAFRWGVASLPMGPAKSATYLAGEHLTIFKSSRNPDEAWRFVKWFTEAEQQAEFSIVSGYLPVRKSSLAIQSYKDYLKTDPFLAAFIDQIKIAQARASIDYHKIEINQLIAGAIEKTLLGNVSPEKSLNEAVKLSAVYMNK
ncbi:MAG: ABC transporter substrate-binding protein [Melioribacteraceae bacterium]|nr:ABC transporter substrate-binding protein [Melioribacteraceae bacterium]